MGNGVHDELIRKKDALDALMAERKRLLAKGQKGAEHVLTHHGYNVIDELPPVQSDVHEMNVGDMISRRAAMERLMVQNVIMDGSEYHNGFNAGVNRAQEVIRNLPPVQTEIIHCKDCKFANMTVDGECKYCDIWFPDEKTYMPGDYYCASAERKDKADGNADR